VERQPETKKIIGMKAIGKLDQANLRTVYQELCTSYHGIANFRAKLLGKVYGSWHR
jgi:hypothetical protein